VPDVTEELSACAHCADARAAQCSGGSTPRRTDWTLAQPPGAGRPDRRARPLERGRRGASERARRAALACVAEAAHEVGRLSARVTSLSPEATLQRGYAVVQRVDGTVVRRADEVASGDTLSARVAVGRIPMTVSA